MASTIQTILFVNYIVSVYPGFFIIITGLIGNLINILVFTQLKLFRKNQSAFYLAVASIIDCYQLSFITSTRVIAAAFGYDPTQSSTVWCKLRIYLAQFGSTTLATIICFAAIDQFLSTNYQQYLRQISTFKLAQRLVCILIILAVLYCICFPIFYEIRPSAGCATYNPIFNYYYSFIHLCIVIGILPIVISSSFSLLAYRNVRHIIRRQMSIHRRRLDRQLTAMILVRVALFVMTTLPYVSFRIYQINSSIDQSNISYLVVTVQLIKTTFTEIYTINYSGSFYIFAISSTRFRRQVKYLFFKKIWRKCLLNNRNRNQIVPRNQIAIIMSRPSSIDLD